MKYMSRKDWRNYISGRSNKGLDPEKTAAIIRDWINVYLKESQTGTEGLQKALSGQSGDPAYTARMSAILKRWNQIQCLCEDALSATDSHD